ncbi:MAG: hypothetical protein ACF8QF_02885 [Phycisphaerales bacterium]
MSEPPTRSRRVVRIGALALAWVWAVGWVILGAMFGTGGLEGRDAVVGAIMQAIIPGMVFVGVALVATRSALWGGLSLVVIGSLVGALYPMRAPGESISAIIFIEGLMALPPLVAGALLILTKSRVRPSPDAAPPAGDLP